MTKYKVQTFSSYDITTLENKINKWLDTAPNIEIKSLNYSTCNPTNRILYSAIILYYNNHVH